VCVIMALPFSTMRSLFIVFVCTLGTAFVGHAQMIKGRVVEQLTQAPVAFVNISVQGTRLGTMTDIDGQFTLVLRQTSGTLLVSSVGYTPKQIPFNVVTTTSIRVELMPATATLNEVVVRPGPNPAHTIIERVLANRERNNPEKLPQFRYNAYTKLFVTPAKGFALRSDYAEEDTATVYFDTTAAARSVTNKPHLFMSESYSERLFKAPGKSQETVLANRVSGFTNPLFTVLGTQFQPFGFYDNTLKVLDKDYLNPVNPGYARNYDLELVDTLFRETDSVYVIRFSPKEKLNFEGLSGVLHISTDGYAMQTITAQSLDATQPFAFRIQQQYKKISSQWFPDQLHADLYYQGDRFSRVNSKTKERTSPHFLMAIRTYLSNIDVKTPLQSRQFGYQTIRLSPTMNRIEATAWDTLRSAPLTTRETRTYKLYENLRKTGANRAGQMLDGFGRVVEALILGRIPVGKVDLLTNRFLRFNGYESVRLGVGAQTNRQLLSWLQADGYVGYGFRDRSLKYGVGLQLNLADRIGLTLRSSFEQDINEPGQANIPTGQNAFSGSQFRAFFANISDSTRRTHIELSGRPIRNLLVTVSGQTEWRNPTYAYRFVSDPDKAAALADSTFQTTQLSIGFRWARREQLTRIKDQDVLTQPSWPVLAARLTQGFSGVAGGQFDFTKLEARFDHSFPIRRLGRSTFQFIGGQIWAPALPYSYLFTGRGILAQGGRQNKRSFSNSLVYVPGYFQTVGLYEFTNDRYINLFYQHNLGRVLFQTHNKYFRPEFALVGNVGWGALRNPEFHKSVLIQSMEKGLFEAGLLVKRLLVLSVGNSQYTLGAGLTRRLGAYQSATENKNWAFNLTLFDLF
jgi:Family of unknown function (DUF5686)/CarboxypepD_reg-like domain